MKYKAVFIDLDGTLLRSDKTVSEETVKATVAAQAKGIHVIINSARILAEVEDILKTTGIHASIISNDGAIVKDGMSGKIISKIALKKSFLRKIAELSIRENLCINMLTAEKTYMGREAADDTLRNSTLPKDIILTEKDTEHVIISEKSKWFSVIDRERDNITLCELYCDTMDDFHRVRKELGKLKEAESTSSEPPIIELTGLGVSKGFGMQVFLKYHGIDPKRCMAIGDSENDMSMLKIAGCSVAMGNAQRIVRENAAHITDTNDNDGVARAIRKLALSE